MSEAVDTAPNPRLELAEQTRREAHEVAAAVGACETNDEKSDTFFRMIRETGIPYLPCKLRDEPEELYARCYDALFILARANLPLAVGFAMHQYNLAALATLPVPSAPEFENRRKILVDMIERYKSLLAICSFGSNIRGRNVPDPNVLVEVNERGEYVFNGRKNFTSMATKADLLLFSAYVDPETMGMFYCQMKGQKTIVPGKSLFAGAMVLTDTKPIEFKNLVLKRRNVLSTKRWLTYHVSNYATAWFEALVSAAYLGGASAALEEVRKFARSVDVSKGKALSELDGFILDAGRLAARHRAGLAFGQSFGACAARYCDAMKNNAPEAVQDGICVDIMDSSGTIKYTCTRLAQDIVNGARGLVGTRSMAVGHPIHALTEQICFGSLHPIIPARFEREMGEELLEEKPYMGLFDWAFG